MRWKEVTYEIRPLSGPYIAQTWCLCNEEMAINSSKGSKKRSLTKVIKDGFAEMVFQTGLLNCGIKKFTNSSNI